jgi:hypothetical protein
MKTIYKSATLVGAIVSQTAHAALDPAIAAAQTEGQADIAVMGGGALLMVVALAVWRYLKRAP